MSNTALFQFLRLCWLRLSNVREYQFQKLLAEKARIELQDAKERQKIAHHFNCRYVLGAKFFKQIGGVFDGPEDGVGLCGIPALRGNAWMCPTCNEIHASVGMCTFTGLQYPACCEFPKGSRHDDLPAVAIDKRPIGHYGLKGLLQRQREFEAKWYP